MHTSHNRTYTQHTNSTHGLTMFYTTVRDRNHKHTARVEFPVTSHKIHLQWSMCIEYKQRHFHIVVHTRTGSL